MKILVLNCGSSSIKYKLYDMADESVLAQGGAERIGLDEAFVKVTMKDGSKEKLMHDMPSHKEGVKFVLDLLVDPKYGCLKNLDEIDAVGHRIVQGGDLFEKSCIVTPEVEKGIESLIDLAPVHNKGHLAGLRAVDALMPGTPQVTVFDNAFHSTMPPYAYLYAVPYEFYTKWHVRRYGFHGTSHRYVSARCAELMGKPIEDLKIISCHMGNGSSVCAINGGKSVDTSMGFTPLAGLPMGTRSGDLDAGILQYIMNKYNMNIDEMLNILNKKSGVMGVSGVSSDFRDLEEAFEQGNERAGLAVDMFNYGVKKLIGAYAAAMGGVDAIIFTAGVGENSASQRMAIASGLEFMGVKMDEDANKVRGEERVISAPDSKVTVLLIPTNEELMIAMDTEALVG